MNTEPQLIEFKEQTVIIAKDQPEYRPLPAYQFPDDPEGKIVFCWRLSWRDRFKVLFRGLLWHQVMTFCHPLQPQLLLVDKPAMPPHTEKHRRENEQQKFELAMIAKYGDEAMRRKKSFDLWGYHPNDRRRTVKFCAEDYDRAKEFQMLHLLGCRIVREK